VTEQPHRTRRPEVLVELRVDRSAVAPVVEAVEEQHLGDRLAAFIDGELDHDGRERVQAHLATCSACLNRAEDERRIKSRIAEALPPDPSALFLAKLMNIAGDDADRRPPSGGTGGRRGFGGAFGSSSAFGGGDSFGSNGFGSGRFGSNALGADHPVPGVDPRAERDAHLFQGESRSGGPVAARLRAGFAPGDSRPQSFPPQERSREQSAPRPSAARGRRFAFAAAGAFSVAAVALGSAITGVSSAEPTVDEPYGNVAPVADTAGAQGGAENVGGYGRNSGQLAFGVPANLPGEFSQPLVTPSASATALPATGSDSVLRSVSR